MSFNVPTLADVSRTIENGFSAAFYGSSGTLRVGVLKVLSKVIAGGCYLPILFCQYIFRNSFIDTADVENLVRFGGWYNLPHKVASLARGTAFVSFTAKATLPAGTILVDENTGDEYEVMSDVVNDSSSAAVKSVNLVASVVGSQCNRTSSERTYLVVRDGTIEGVGTIYTLTIGGGSSYDVSVNGVTEQWGEDVESYRARLKYRRQHQPMGGADSDYKQWAERFSQVSDAVVLPNYPDTNCVSVFCADYNGNISINSTLMEEVIDYITSSSRKPITACVHVASVTPVNIGLQIRLDNIGGTIKSDIVSLLTKKFKGFGLGERITTNVVKQILLDNGICEDCTIDKLLLGNVDYTNAGYTFVKKFENDTLYGEVLNTTYLAEHITLVSD